MFISGFNSLTVKTWCRHPNYDTLLSIRTIYVSYIRGAVGCTVTNFGRWTTNFKLSRNWIGPLPSVFF